MAFGSNNNSVKSDEEIEVRIAQYLLNNPAPNDMAFHAFAAGIGEDKERVEEIAYRMLATVLHAANSWGLLGRDDKEVETMLYMSNCDVSGETQNLMSDNPRGSANMIDLVLRVRHKASIDKLTRERNRVLSYAEEQSIDSEIHRKHSDRVQVNDQSRINTVNQELASLGLDQGSVDTGMRLLELDGYVNEATLINGAYSSMREALVASTNYVFDDPLFTDLKKAFKGLPQDNREFGDSIRVARARQAARLMREISTKYGISNRGLFSGLNSKS